MANRLADLASGTVKGLVSVACCIPIGYGLPAADGLARTLKTRTETVAYNTVMVGAIIAVASAGYYAITN